MKATLMSDIHLEFGDFALSNNENSDILILAGDIVPAAGITDNPVITKRAREFFDVACAQWETVLMVMGNHEHYMGDIATSIEIINTFVNHDNFHILENRFIDIGDWRFIGATLWTSMNDGDPLTELHAKSAMNDYRAILNNSKPLEVNTTASFHGMSVEYIDLFSSECDKNVFVITHHSPSFKSVHPRFQNDALMNGAFHSDLEWLMAERDNIKYWAHGHVHDFMDYTLYDTRVICNPRGYIGIEAESINFTPLVIDLVI